MTEKELVKVDDVKTQVREFLKNFGFAKALTEKEQLQFLNICQAFHLNPIKREIHPIVYKNKDGSRTLQPITGYEVYIKRAERTGQLDGWNVELNGDGSDLQAIITIHRKDFSQPFVWSVDFDEYNQDNYMWKSKPRFMLKKVAIATGFRLCFSDELGGMPYSQDEMPEGEVLRNVSEQEEAPIEPEPKESTAIDVTPKKKKKNDASKPSDTFQKIAAAISKSKGMPPTKKIEYMKEAHNFKDDEAKLSAILTDINNNFGGQNE